MPYKLLIKKPAQKMLDHAPKPERHRILEKIILLKENPGNQQLDIKKLEGRDFFSFTSWSMASCL